MVEIKKYFEEKANYAYGARLLKFTIVVLVVLLTVNSIATFVAVQRQMVVLIPPTLSTQVFISGTDASNEYLTAMARYISALALNYNPSTVRSQFNDFLALFNPSAFAKHKEAFYSLAGKVETANVSSTFFVSSIQVNRAKKNIVLTGLLNQWTQDKQFIINETKKYMIKYEIADGKFQIIEFKEYKHGE